MTLIPQEDVDNESITALKLSQKKGHVTLCNYEYSNTHKLHKSWPWHNLDQYFISSMHFKHHSKSVSDSPVVKRGLLVVSCPGRLRGFSGKVRDVEAGDDCVRDRGRWTPRLLPTPPLPLLRNMGTARVSICRCSCCSCFCCSHSND